MLKIDMKICATVLFGVWGGGLSKKNPLDGWDLVANQSEAQDVVPGVPDNGRILGHEVDKELLRP